jgi:hypothetical protein
MYSLKPKELEAMYCIETQEFSCNLNKSNRVNSVKKMQTHSRERNKNHNKQLIVLLFVSRAPLFCCAFPIFLRLLRTLSCLVAWVCIFFTIDLPHGIFIWLRKMHL